MRYDMYNSVTGGTTGRYRGVNSELKRNNPDYNEIFEMGVKRGIEIEQAKKQNKTLIIRY